MACRWRSLCDQNVTLDKSSAEYFGPDQNAINNPIPGAPDDNTGATVNSFNPPLLEPGISIYTEAMG